MIIIFASNILLAAALSADAFGIGVTYGLRGVKIPLKAKGIIFVISFFIATAGEISGYRLLNVLPVFIIKMTGFLILMTIGIYTVFSNPFSFDMDKSLNIDSREALFMGIALSADSVGAVIANATFAGSSNMLPLAIAFCQLFFLNFGQILGRKISRNNSSKYRLWTILSGAVIIAIAVLRIVN